jgi:GNAT superfamily N-acetyltransferase
MFEKGNSSLALSLKDSVRFGLDIYRATIVNPEEKTIFAGIVENNVDVAILRSPVGTSGHLQRLRRFGFDSIHADTLVYYGVDLEFYQPNPLRNVGIVFEEASPRDSIALAELVVKVFSGYQSHYHSNPLFPPSAILAGYAEWAQDHLIPDSHQHVWVVRSDTEIIAFACCKSDREAATCEGVLYGVHPQYAGRGLYGDLIRFTQAWFKEHGFRSMHVSTQIQNLAVQKVWAREGFHLAQAYDTYHVNALLSNQHGWYESHLLRFTAAQVEAFARLSGDTNPVHFDNDVARQAGFNARICHGLLPVAELSRVFGTQNPGAGTLFLGMRIAFLRPIYHETDHTLHIRFANDPAKEGHNVAMALVKDPCGRICMLAYSDLMRRNIGSTESSSRDSRIIARQ